LARAAAAGALIEVDARVAGESRIWQARGYLPAQTVIRIEVSQLKWRDRTYTGSWAADLITAAEAPLTESGQQLQVGQRISLKARSSRAEATDGIAARLNLSGTVIITVEPGWLDLGLNGLRAGLTGAMRWSPDDQAGLVPAMVVGDTAGMSQQVTDTFRTVGLSHLTAVSGTNLTLMLGFVLLSARGLGVRSWWLRGISVLAVAGFVLLCRGEPSVLRAAAMGLAALAALGLAGRAPPEQRRSAGLRGLGTAILVVLLVDPLLCRSWGFALSACATAGIIWWSPGWAQLLSRWLPESLAQVLVVPLAAQLATAPLVAALSGQVSIVGVLTNIAVGVFVGPVTVLGLLACLVAPLWGTGGAVFGWLAGWCCEPILLVARFAAGLPGAAWTFTGGPALIAGVVVACVALAFGLGQVLGHRWATSLLGVVLVTGVLVGPVRIGWPGQWQAAFCDVGQGDATVLRAADGVAVVFDTGPESEPLLTCLSDLDISQVAAVVLTHHHADHTGGLAGLARDYDIGQLVVRPATGDDILKSIHNQAPGVPVVTAQPGAVFTVGQATWTILQAGIQGPSSVSNSEEDAAENNAGIIALARVGDLTVLLTGDAEPAAQTALTSTDTDLRADVLKVPHHGSANQDRDFLESVQAPVAVFSVGADNSYGHPAPSTVTALQQTGAHTYRTDHHGTIAVSKTAETLTVATQQ
jgi:competence protein ComEC